MNICMRVYSKPFRFRICNYVMVETRFCKLHFQKNYRNTVIWREKRERERDRQTDRQTERVEG